MFAADRQPVRISGFRGLVVGCILECVARQACDQHQSGQAFGGFGVFEQGRDREVAASGVPDEKRVVDVVVLVDRDVVARDGLGVRSRRCRWCSGRDRASRRR